MLILDFDLDFVVHPIRRGAAEQNRRYEEPGVKVWSRKVFKSFLENRMHLSLNQRIPGKACEHHKEVFFLTEQLIRDGSLRPPLHWVHVDAHDDIFGCSDSTPVNSANFLLHLIGRDWLSHIEFVLPDGEDQPPACLIKWNPLRIQFDEHQTTISYQDETTYRLERRPDFVFLTRSPDFTPKAADPLFDLSRFYITECAIDAIEVLK